MTRTRYAPDDPREWLGRARSNLVQAQTEHPDIYLEDLCFQAQQAAEKALKAILLDSGKAFPHTHDIAHLLTLIEHDVMDIPSEFDDAALLTKYAVATRYPGVIEEVAEDEYSEALQLASGIVDWAERAIHRAV
jgi:HEPN domain-containing protein